jgi:hypothetical protein
VAPQAIAATQRRGGAANVERVVRGQSPSDLDWTQSKDRTLAASDIRKRSSSVADNGVAPSRLPPDPPTPTAAKTPQSASRIPDVAAADDVTPTKGTLIPIAVGRARRSHSASEQ